MIQEILLATFFTIAMVLLFLVRRDSKETREMYNQNK